MKYIKQFEGFEFAEDTIEQICDQYGINFYTINSDGTIDVSEDIYLNDRKLTKIPLRFNIVEGDFSCHNNNLISLDGCPNYVSGNFDCSLNKLTSLEFSPKDVKGSFICYYNKLETLKGCTPNILGDFDCHHNQLISLEFSPKYVGNEFDCSQNNLKTTKNITPNCQRYLIWENPLPYDIFKLNTGIDFDFDDIVLNIINLQDEFMIWNSDDTLNLHNFQELLKEIK